MRYNTIVAAAAAALSAAVSVSARDREPPGEPRKALPESAPADHIKYQPVLDYDTDSCYNVPAIDAKGNVSEGLTSEWTGTSVDCRDASDLDNQNVYSRKRCNNGWCAYMYEHYFEKDVAMIYASIRMGGHRHEWQAVVVWVKDGDEMPSYVAATRYDDKYETAKAKHVRFQDTHAKIVYHKAGLGSHSFRFARKKDDKVENHKHEWIRGALIGWTRWPSTSLRDKMLQAFIGGKIKCKLHDALFGEHLKMSIDGRIPEFNVHSNSDE